MRPAPLFECMPEIIHQVPIRKRTDHPQIPFIQKTDKVSRATHDQKRRMETSRHPCAHLHLFPASRGILGQAFDSEQIKAGAPQPE